MTEQLTADQSNALQLVADYLGANMDGLGKVIGILSPSEGCVPENEIGDDLMTTIRHKFGAVYFPAMQLATSVLKDGGIATDMELAIQPSYEDRSQIVILDAKRSRYYLGETHRAWNFSFTSTGELADRILEIRDQIVAKATKLLTGN